MTPLLTNFSNSYLYKRKSPNLIKLGFDFNQPINKEFLKIQSLLYTLYHIKNHSMLTIMKEFDIPSSRTMDIIFRIFDIESRTFSESQSLAIELERANAPLGNVYKIIYHTSWFNETFCLRSSYEEDYAKLLDQSKVRYFVEHMRIKYFDSVEERYRIAIPDFYLPESNTIVEVKSTYWLNEKNMRDKKLAYTNLGFNFALNLDGCLLTNW